MTRIIQIFGFFLAMAWVLKNTLLGNTDPTEQTPSAPDPYPPHLEEHNGRWYTENYLEALKGKHF